MPVSNPDPRAVALDRFEPAEPFSLFTRVDSPLADRRAAWTARLLASYAERPLTLRLSDGERAPLIRHQGVLHAQLALRVVDGWTFDVDLPSTWASAGRPLNVDGRELAPPAPVALHDARIGSRLSVSRPIGWIPGIGLSARLWLPTGDDRAFTSDGRVRYAFQGLIGADLGAWSYRIALGRSGHGARGEPGLLAGNSELGVALGYRPLAELLVGSELELSRVAGRQPSFAGAETHAELLASARFARGPWALRLGAGPGLGSALGTPRWRVIASIELAAEATDRADAGGPMDAARPAGGAFQAGRVVPVLATDAPALAPFEPAALSAAPTSLSAAPGMAQPSSADSTQTSSASPTQPSKADSTQTSSAGPAPPPATLRGDRLELEGEVLFETGSDAIDPASDALLASVARVLDANPEIVRVAVDGHTDGVGSEHENLVLSQRRAIAVVRRLVAAGVDERRLQARGLGPRQPRQSNDSDAGRSANRRVEFIVIRQDPAGRRSWQEGPVDGQLDETRR